MRNSTEKNGVVQAIEDPEKRFVLGVQFHPEFMLHRRKFRRIFEMLIEAAKTSKALTPLQIATMSEEATAGKETEEEARRHTGPDDVKFVPTGGESFIRGPE